jgi:outer membrane lipoprotein-sorting protein
MTLPFPSRRAVLAGAVAVPAALPRLAWAQSATLALPPDQLALVDNATKYLNALDSAQGRFEQTNPRGVVSNGQIFLQRPGKARFQYDPPSGLLVVADGKSVSVWDGRLRTFDRKPLGATPLAILLAKRVRLDEEVEVFQVGRFGADGFYLSARKAGGGRGQGYITLMFGDDPVVLRGWTVVDGQGQATKIVIPDLTRQPVKPDLFVLDDPRTPEEKAAGRRG